MEGGAGKDVAKTRVDVDRKEHVYFVGAEGSLPECGGYGE